jgi:hypothetical protein
MQPGHEELSLAPEKLSLAPEELSSAPELEELLLDESSFFAHEMMVRLKRDMRIICKILFISFYSTVMRGNKFEK